MDAAVLVLVIKHPNGRSLGRKLYAFVNIRTRDRTEDIWACVPECTLFSIVVATGRSTPRNFLSGMDFRWRRQQVKCRGKESHRNLSPALGLTWQPLANYIFFSLLPHYASVWNWFRKKWFGIDCYITQATVFEDKILGHLTIFTITIPG